MGVREGGRGGRGREGARGEWREGATIGREEAMV